MLFGRSVDEFCGCYVDSFFVDAMWMNFVDALWMNEFCGCYVTYL